MISNAFIENIILFSPYRIMSIWFDKVGKYKIFQRHLNRYEFNKHWRMVHSYNTNNYPNTFQLLWIQQTKLVKCFEFNLDVWKVACVLVNRLKFSCKTFIITIWGNSNFTGNKYFIINYASLDRLHISSYNCKH